MRRSRNLNSSRFKRLKTLVRADRRPGPAASSGPRGRPRPFLMRRPKPGPSEPLSADRAVDIVDKVPPLLYERSPPRHQGGLAMLHALVVGCGLLAAAPVETAP